MIFFFVFALSLFFCSFGAYIWNAVYLYSLALCGSLGDGVSVSGAFVFGICDGRLLVSICGLSSFDFSVRFFTFFFFVFVRLLFLFPFFFTSFISAGSLYCTLLLNGLSCRSCSCSCIDIGYTDMFTTVSAQPPARQVNLFLPFSAICSSALLLLVLLLACLPSRCSTE
ncbi:hypothetical protein BZA05DRAFT_83427 [Tricharina praecox]|uniref:uncharacterized protein n=1 Tax=Tricharina praecox TaxID=43433 RepID=UPI002220E597|nr:uncharacterized protein BZA05DRAFT_83427 [Tricharina praecox]KAI5849129.1 hypothetical protein BZA05DRAFT_83427 [Tricharina praecox]